MLYEVIYMKCPDREIHRQWTCGCRGRGRKQWKEIPRQYGVSIGDNKNTLELDSGDVYTIF